MPLDPYRQWLEIPDAQRPPNYYALLGLPGPKVSPAEIESAYSRRMQTVRRYQMGTHMQVAQQLISELSEAYVCLSDPAKKKHYDDRLHGAKTLDTSAATQTIESPPVASAAVLPAPAVPVQAQPLTSTPLLVVAGRPLSASRVRRKRPMPAALIASCVVGLIGAGVVWLARSNSSSQPSPPPALGESPVAPVASVPKPPPVASVEKHEPAPEAPATSLVEPIPQPAVSTAPAVNTAPAPPAAATTAPAPAVVTSVPAQPDPAKPAAQLPRTLAPPTSISLGGLLRPVNGVAWNPAGTQLVINAQPTILADALTGQQLPALSTDECARSSWSPDGRRVALHLYRKSPVVLVHDLETGQEVFSVNTYKATDGFLFGFSPTADSLAVFHSQANGSFENQLTLVKFGKGKPGLQVLDEFQYPARVAWKSDGTTLAWATRGALRGIRTTKIPVRGRRTPLAASADFENLLWVPNQRFLAGTSPQGLLVIDMAKPKTPLLQLAGVTQASHCSFSSDGKLASVIVGGELLTFALVDARTPRWRQPGLPAWTALAWSPAADRLAAVDATGKIHIWDPAGQIVTTADSRLTTSSRAGLVFSPNGDRLAVFGQDARLAVFDTSQLAAKSSVEADLPSLPQPLAWFTFDNNAENKGAGEAKFDLRNTQYKDDALFLNGKYHITDKIGYLAECRTPTMSFETFTVALRFKADDFSGKKTNLLTGGPAYRWFGLSRSAGGNVTVILNNLEFSRGIPDASIAADKWTTLSCSVDIPARKVVACLNGTSTREIDLPKDFELTVLKWEKKESDKVWTFTNHSTGTTFNGLIDEFLIYGRALSEHELRHIPLRP